MLALEALLGAGFDRGTGCGQFLQPHLAPLQLLRNGHPIGDVGLIRRLGFYQQIGHFLLELGFDPAGVLVAQRAVAAGVGVDLGAVQRHRTHLQHADLTRQQQHLDEQRLDLL